MHRATPDSDAFFVRALASITLSQTLQSTWRRDTRAITINAIAYIDNRSIARTEIPKLSSDVPDSRFLTTMFNPSWPASCDYND
jgi:hypothetical protein